MSNWLLLRGLARDARHWMVFPKKLEEGLGDRAHRTFCIDFPGMGNRHHEEAPKSISEMVDAVRPELLRLKEEHGGEWNLLSISLGSMAAMDWCERHPNDFNRAVFINTSARNLAAPWQRMRIDTLASLLKIFWVRDMIERERIILRSTSHQLEELEEVAKIWADFTPEGGHNKKGILRQLMAAIRFQAPEKIDIPALIICSANDRLANPVCSERLADRFGAPLRKHEWAGHDLPLQDGEWIVDQIRDWLEDSSDRSKLA